MVCHYPEIRGRDICPEISSAQKSSGDVTVQRSEGDVTIKRSEGGVIARPE